MASGQQNSASDIDILILGSLKLIDLVKVLSPLAQMLRREINPVVMTAEKFSGMVGQSDRFAVRVVEEPKLFVIGDAVEFAELGKNRPTR